MSAAAAALFAAAALAPTSSASKSTALARIREGPAFPASRRFAAAEPAEVAPSSPPARGPDAGGPAPFWLAGDGRRRWARCGRAFSTSSPALAAPAGGTDSDE